ncbi:MAG: SDR family oxidoreductase [Tumebacillaceae bacterium]
MFVSHTYFFTGFPGFIASRLIKKLLQRDDHSHFELLVHPSQWEKAHREVEWLVRNHFGQSKQFTILKGDITKDNLGIDELEMQGLLHKVTHVFHLAAIYDLAVPRDIAYQVNVVGTDNVNRWVQQLSRLQRYVYFSTAYVSGDRTGRIMETELDRSQKFKNFYEETKFQAEVLVQGIRDRVPVTIIRPGIVMGDSRTGETAKFDGPYFVMRFLDRFRKFPIPFVGKGEAQINLVPVDYIVDATLFLALSDVGVNKVYHLTDPQPYSSSEAYARICEELLGKKPTWIVPPSWVLSMLAISVFRRWVRVEKETLAYFSCPAEYDSTQAHADLQQAGVQCPEFDRYIGQAVAYYKKYRNDPEKMIMVR